MVGNSEVEPGVLPRTLLEFNEICSTFLCKPSCTPWYFRRSSSEVLQPPFSGHASPPEVAQKTWRALFSSLSGHFFQPEVALGSAAIPNQSCEEPCPAIFGRYY